MEIHSGPDGKLTMTDTVLQNGSDYCPCDLFATLPPNPKAPAYPEQKLRTDDLDNSQYCKLFGDVGDLNEEMRASFNEDFESQPLYDYPTIEEYAFIASSPSRKPVVYTTFATSTTDDGSSSPATATTSSLSAVSSLVNLPHLVNKAKCFKLQLPFKIRRKKRAKTIVEGDGVEFEVNGSMVESGFNGKLHYRLSPVSCCSISSTDASVGESKSLKPASGGKSSKYFPVGMWKKSGILACSHSDYGVNYHSSHPSGTEIHGICSGLSPEFLKRAEDGSSHSGFSAETEIWNNLTQKYSGAEKYRLEDFESDANSLCEGVALMELEYSDDPDAQFDTSMFGMSDVNAAVYDKECQPDFQPISNGNEVELLFRKAAEEDPLYFIDQSFVNCDESDSFEQPLLSVRMGPSSAAIEGEDEFLDGLKVDFLLQELKDESIEVVDKEDKDGSIKSPTLISYQKLSTPEDEAYISSSSSDSSRSSSSELSFCSQGILKPPRRAKSNYDPFGIHSDFTLPRPRRRVHFSNIDELNQDGALYKVMQNQKPDYSSDSSASTSSLIFLAQYIGCHGIDGDEVSSASSC
mmetsp:Transcript_12926/g.26455  ORF Transcript_12926/g.26455 Transcript_12926/m.26455 type:complete len:577 (+) Transcript_12926:185-1915(+)